LKEKTFFKKNRIFQIGWVSDLTILSSVNLLEVQNLEFILINETLGLYNTMCVLQYMMLGKHHMVCVEANKWWIRDE